jgi:hypothetical protein
VQPGAGSFSQRLPKQSQLTGLAACLFTGGVVLLFFVLYHDAIRSGPLMWLAVVLLIGSLACWVASARAGERGG